MLKLDYFWRMLCHTAFSFDSFGVSVWMEKQEANARGWQDSEFLPLPRKSIHIWGAQLTSIPTSPTKRDELLRWPHPDAGFVLSWPCPTIRHACALSWIYVLAIVYARLCMLQVVGVCFWHWAVLGMSVLCSVRLTPLPVLVRASNGWVCALCSLSSTEASAKFTGFWVLLW